MAEPVRVGPVHYIKPGGKKSSKKYAALHARTQKPPRLEIFDNKESFEKNGKKQIVNLENCSPLEADSNSCAIRITVESKTLSITLDNYEEYSAWLSDLNFTLFGYSSGSEYYSVLDDAQLYDVVIHETDVARRLHLKGSYYLYVSLEEVELLNKQTKKSVIKWPLYQLRKYGRDKQEFSLEAGRRCQSGEGMFYFKTDQYNAIFQEVEHNVKALASRGRAATHQAPTATPSTTRNPISRSNHHPRAPSTPGRRSTMTPLMSEGIKETNLLLQTTLTPTTNLSMLKNPPSNQNHQSLKSARKNQKNWDRRGKDRRNHLGSWTRPLRWSAKRRTRKLLPSRTHLPPSQMNTAT
uniref:IRS-type PTB domain-containing protein n=1 Tax=Ciona savignyi TaxID=51511 RepID=H2ZKF1_CIOSA